MEKRFFAPFHALHSVELAVLCWFVFSSSWASEKPESSSVDDVGEFEAKVKLLRIVQVRLLFELNKLCLSLFDYRFLWCKSSFLFFSRTRLSPFFSKNKEGKLVLCIKLPFVKRRERQRVGVSRCTHAWHQQFPLHIDHNTFKASAWMVWKMLYGLLTSFL